MGLREVAWVIFLGGLPFSPMFNRQVDLWHAQTFWAHGCLALLIGVSLAIGNRRMIKNPPLGMWFAWTLFMLAYAWQWQMAHRKQYTLTLLMPMTHQLSILMFYWAAVQTWTMRTFRTVLTTLAAVGIIMTVYGYIQWAGLDEFFRDIDGNVPDVIQGTIGNTSHFSIYLAVIIPTFLMLPGFWKLWAIPASILIFKIYSAGGLLALGSMLLFVSWFYSKKLSISLFTIFLLLGAYELYQGHLFNPQGRIAVWHGFWRIFEDNHPIIGMGSGFVMQLSQTVTNGILYRWRHVHNEFFQITIEQGFIGLGIFIWGLVHMVRTWLATPRTKESIVVAGMLAAFLTNCLVNFPMHLWMTSSLALVAYTGVYFLRMEHAENTV